MAAKHDRISSQAQKNKHACKMGETTSAFAWSLVLACNAITATKIYCCHNFNIYKVYVCMCVCVKYVTKKSLLDEKWWHK